jgi:hypothetical protein
LILQISARQVSDMAAEDYLNNRKASLARFGVQCAPGVPEATFRTFGCMGVRKVINHNAAIS